MSGHKPPLAPEVHQPDHFWEYLNDVASYTINLRNEINNVCLMAVNNNIVKYQPDPAALSAHIEKALAATKAVDEALPGIKAQHVGKTGYAMGVENLSEFLRIHELYVQQQALLMDAMQTSAAAILAMSDSAHANAVAAGAKDQINDLAQIKPGINPTK